MGASLLLSNIFSCMNICNTVCFYKCWSNDLYSQEAGTHWLTAPLLTAETVNLQCFWELRMEEIFSQKFIFFHIFFPLHFFPSFIFITAWQPAQWDAVHTDSPTIAEWNRIEFSYRKTTISSSLMHKCFVSASCTASLLVQGPATLARE